MSPLLQLTISQALGQMKDGHISAQDLTKAYLDQIEKTNHLNTYITVTAERAMADACESDRRWAQKSPRPLEGIPISLKDAFCTKGIRTTAASRILGNFIPPYESTVSKKMQEAGTVLLGKNNMDEFSMGSMTTPVFSGPTRNPWDPSCIAGGSSGGGAAAVACGAALGALGTDTGGSVRQPVACCGIVGVRPTYGRCSRWGMVAFASSLDQASPIARSVEDAALLLEAMAGYDPMDSTSVNLPVPAFHNALGQSVKGMKVGIPHHLYQGEKADPAILALWKEGEKIFREAGCDIVPVSLPYAEYALPCYYILVCAEAASNLQRYDGVKYGLRDPSSDLEEMYALTRGRGFGPEVKNRILMGTFVLSHGYYDAYYSKAQKVRRLIQQDFAQAFQKVDILLTPTTPSSAFPFDAIPDDPVAIYYNDLLTVPVNIGNVSAISLPAGLSPQGLPLGLQLIAPPFQEDRLFQFGAVLEKSVRMPSLPFAPPALS
jgi:aspartyl-tRNA(Asn)/glutamyl-tRNA(Gln) amidotransferase subunit A